MYAVSRFGVASLATKGSIYLNKINKQVYSEVRHNCRTFLAGKSGLTPNLLGMALRKWDSKF